ncbi:hypothetical protein HanIR_Chr06g0289391 [Helianthus annuus]|nr:hypothetical protein HanIR_Chr06g0289391 [Helianthus annuus]
MVEVVVAGVFRCEIVVVRLACSGWCGVEWLWLWCSLAVWSGEEGEGDGVGGKW